MSLFDENNIHQAIKTARKMIILVIGFTLLVIGILMIVLPGPALVVIPLSLAVLGSEYLWARRLLKHIKKRAQLFKDHTQKFKDKIKTKI